MNLKIKWKMEIEFRNYIDQKKGQAMLILFSVYIILSI